MTWEIEITGDKSDLEELSKVLSEKDLSIVKENERFILKSENFDTLSDYGEVKTKVNELLNSVNAIAQISFDSREVIKYNHISQLDENGIERIFIEFKMGAFGRSSTHISLSSGTEICNSIGNWIKIAKDDDNVKDVFKLIVYDFNSLVTLYKIIEILQKDDFKPIKRSGIYFSEVERLNQSANSYKATGVESRHHLDRNKPPDIPMLLPEAKSFMKMVLIQWLAQKEQKWLKQKE